MIESLSGLATSAASGIVALATHPVTIAVFAAAAAVAVIKLGYDGLSLIARDNAYQEEAERIHQELNQQGLENDFATDKRPMHTFGDKAMRLLSQLKNAALYSLKRIRSFFLWPFKKLAEWRYNRANKKLAEYAAIHGVELDIEPEQATQENMKHAMEYIKFQDRNDRRLVAWQRLVAWTNVSVELEGETYFRQMQAVLRVTKVVPAQEVQINAILNEKIGTAEIDLSKPVQTGERLYLLAQEKLTAVEKKNMPFTLNPWLLMNFPNLTSGQWQQIKRGYAKAANAADKAMKAAATAEAIRLDKESKLATASK